MKARAAAGTGDKSLPSDPGSQLLASREGESERKSTKIMGGMSKKHTYIYM